MVRYCVIPSCKSSDTNILSHRFPRNEQAVEWQRALGLETANLDELRSKYVVCTKHFKPSDYRSPASNFLNTTAVPLREEVVGPNWRTENKMPQIPPTEGTFTQTHSNSAGNPVDSQTYNIAFESIREPSVSPSYVVVSEDEFKESQTDNIEDREYFEAIDSFSYEENYNVEEVLMDESTATDDVGQETFSTCTIQTIHPEETTDATDYIENYRDDKQGDDSARFKLAQLTKEQLINELITAGQMIDKLQRKLKLHEQVQTDIENSIAKLKT